MKFNYHNPYRENWENAENQCLYEELQYDIAKQQAENIETIYEDDYANENLDESLDDLLEMEDEGS